SSSATSPLSLHDALPIFGATGTAELDPHARAHALRKHRELCRDELLADLGRKVESVREQRKLLGDRLDDLGVAVAQGHGAGPGRSEEHTSELQSQSNLVC